MNKHAKVIGIILCIVASLLLLIMIIAKDFGVITALICVAAYFFGIKNIRGANTDGQKNDSSEPEAKVVNLSDEDISSIVDAAKDSIKISHYGELRDVNATDEEIEIYNILQSYVSDPLELVRKSDSYVSVMHGDRDLARIKFTERAHWISFQIVDSMRGKYAESDLFRAQSNKGQLFWKSNLNNVSDVVNEPAYKELFVAAYNEGF